MDGAGGCEQFPEAEIEMPQYGKAQQRAAAEQQRRLGDLHPRRRLHSADSDVEDHQYADAGDGEEIVDAEQQLDDLARADHLRDQIEQHDDEASDRGDKPDGSAVKPESGRIGKRIASEIAHPLRHQEQNDRPAREEADGVQ
jgi:hypothetical protein